VNTAMTTKIQQTDSNTNSNTGNPVSTAEASPRARLGMRRLLAIVAFAAGGFAAEMGAPLQCTLLHASAPQVKHREV